ncbi:MAG TPA: hypothetical protein VFP08_03210, partial [Acidimicrobiales bacterium]|nr:hypothetical protein [Acidimicrobiales bacterium]
RFLWEVVADAALDLPGGVDIAILTDPRGSVLPDSGRPQAIGVLAWCSPDSSAGLRTLVRLPTGHASL